MKPSYFNRVPTMRRLLCGVATGIVLAAVAVPTAVHAKKPKSARMAPAPAPTVTSELLRQGEPDLLGVYAAREYRPVWIEPAGVPVISVGDLLGLIETAEIDGVARDSVATGEARQALALLADDRSPGAQARAELAVSRLFVNYVAAMAKAPAEAMIYEHGSLRPGSQRRSDVLWSAANAPSLAGHLQSMGWMHPLYATLRRAALAEGRQDDPAVRANLARIRALPAPGQGKSIVVDAAGARLWMYEGGRAVDSMKVVVGKADQQTPMMAGYVRYAIVNPYWNVPDDLVQGKIAAKAQSIGPGYFKSSRFEVMSGWDANAKLVDPATVDWKKVASGQTLQRVRQLPGPANAMGKVKFEFPNPQGIYLHDTPDKALMLKDARQFSSGCVRLEDAGRLGRWLFGTDVIAGSGGPAAKPETRVDLPQLVPVYITYLTTPVENGKVAVRADPYKRDSRSAALAQQPASSQSPVR